MPPTYYVFKMFSVHQNATLIPLQLNTPNYELNGKSVTKVNASASVKEGIVSVTLCNLNPTRSEELSFDFSGKTFSSSFGQIITADKMNDFNDFDAEEEVTLKSFEVEKVKKGKLSVTLPAKSVVLIQLK